MSFRFGLDSTRLVPGVAGAEPGPQLRRIADDAAREIAALASITLADDVKCDNARIVVRPSGESTLLMGSVLGVWSDHDALWDGMLTFRPVNKITSQAGLEDNLGYAVTGGVFAHPALWGARVSVDPSGPLDTFFCGTARAFLRPATHGRTIVAAQLPGVWVQRDEIWEGQLVARPGTTRALPGLDGFRADQVMTSAEFRR